MNDSCSLRARGRPRGARLTLTPMHGRDAGPARARDVMRKARGRRGAGEEGRRGGGQRNHSTSHLRRIENYVTHLCILYPFTFSLLFDV